MSNWLWVALLSAFIVVTAVAPAWAPVPEQVPEPGTLALFGAGFAGLIALRMLRRR